MPRGRFTYVRARQTVACRDCGTPGLAWVRLNKRAPARLCRVAAQDGQGRPLVHATDLHRCRPAREKAH